MLQFKKVTALACAAALLFSGGCQGKDPAQEQEEFDDFIDQVFVDSMESSYLSMHIYLRDPAAYGVDEEAVEVSLGARFDEESMQESKEDFQETYAQFQQFDRELLSDEQKDVYDTFAFEAELADRLNDDKFDYYPQLFESMGGLHTQTASLFTDWELYDEQDVKDLIVLLNDVKPYVDSALDYTRIQEEKGLLMADTASVMEYCEGVLERGMDSSILSSMKQRVADLNLGEEKTSAYQQQLEEAFANSFLPSYQDIYDTMAEMEGADGNHMDGLVAFPDGKEYYELLLQQSIGSEMAPDEVTEMMEEAFDDHLANLQTIIFSDIEGVTPLLEGPEPTTPYESYDAILQHISAQMTADFPKVSNLDYHIENMNEEIASEGIAAYFNIPPLDGEGVKQMRVNPNSADVGSIATYITVAHEGYPGHMYQYAYLYENVDSLYLKSLANIPGYVEGYAVYAGYEALNYMDEMNSSLLQAYKENELASYCLIVNADIGIHYEGWSVEDMAEYFNEYGLALDMEDASLAYDQLWANPVAFQPYYVGYHQFADLREKAQEKLGDDFDAKAFNEAILACGIVPFEVAERHVDAYIEGA